MPSLPVNNPSQDERLALLALAPSAIHEQLCARLSQDLPRYRADQLLEWIYVRRVSTFEAMTNLPADLRSALSAGASLYASRVIAESTASDSTRKLLLEWDAGGTTECVMIPGERRRTACISTQVGCPVKCTFCASGIDGLERNLSAAQIVEQAVRVAALCGPDARLSNVVFMGLGEPLANYDATMAALRCINAEWGLGIAARRITVSTVGLPSQMRRLAQEDLQITLALSLHAPNDALRQELIPWAARVSLDELVAACQFYFERTGREVTLEYILLDGVNNRPQHVRQLADLCGNMRANINLIPYNPVQDLPYVRPSDQSVEMFCQQLRGRGINTHVRHSRGLDADAACGQLRRRASGSAE